MYFHYDHIATDYLCRKDKHLAAAIEGGGQNWVFLGVMETKKVRTGGFGEVC